MPELTEQQICERLYAWKKDGAKSRDDGTVNPHPANTLAHMMHSAGWLTRDLQLALCVADARYAASQINSVTSLQVEREARRRRA